MRYQHQGIQNESTGCRLTTTLEDADWVITHGATDQVCRLEKKHEGAQRGNCFYFSRDSSQEPTKSVDQVPTWGHRLDNTTQSVKWIVNQYANWY